MTTRDDLFEKEVDFFSLLSGVSFLPLLLVSAVLRLPAGLQSPGELMQSPRWVLASYFSFSFFRGAGETLKSAASGMIARKQRTHLTDAVMPLKIPNCVQADDTELFF